MKLSFRAECKFWKLNKTRQSIQVDQRWDYISFKCRSVNFLQNLPFHIINYPHCLDYELAACPLMFHDIIRCVWNIHQMRLSFFNWRYINQSSLSLWVSSFCTQPKEVFCGKFRHHLGSNPGGLKRHFQILCRSVLKTRPSNEEFCLCFVSFRSLLVELLGLTVPAFLRLVNNINCGR